MPPRNSRRRLLPILSGGVVALALAIGLEAEEVAAIGEVDAGNFSGSLVNERDRTAEWILGAAQRAFQAGETTAGVGRLQELF